jgi:nucleotide-binding universal stress UspA family protein
MKPMLLERVLIPLDGTPAAESAVGLLEPILQRSGSEVFLVRALAPGDPRPPAEEADRYLQGFADRFQNGGLCTHTLVSRGSPSEVIESLAADEDVTLIAMSVLPEGVGPVMERLLRGSARHLLALRAPPGAPLSRKSRHSTILVPLDGSEASRRSLPLALELAGILDARVILMRVIEQDDEELGALEGLNGVARRLARQGLAAEIWIERGEPVEKILQVSREEGAELVVLATRGRSDGPDDRLGPVATQVMNRSSVPVLAVHARGA